MINMPGNGQAKQAKFFLLTGHVQGIGFRPFVYRLANTYGIHGWVENWMGQVAIHAEGDLDYLQLFQHNLVNQAPGYSSPVISQSRIVNHQGFENFSIRASRADTPDHIRIIEDLPVCDECLAEMRDEHNRRHGYAFINCTHCGPRYTIIRNLPYDRCNTTMSEFSLCPACSEEYQDPQNRRYHAEPIACSRCGPHLEFRARNATVTQDSEAIKACVTTLRKNGIVAVKGIGGYHLMANAGNDSVVKKLRDLKPRPHKPLAVMMDERMLREYVYCSDDELNRLRSVDRPVVLLRTRTESPLSKLVSYPLNEVGVMLPYSPLHYLIIEAFNGPLLATSANISGEPVITQNREASERLAHVADAFLHHDRPIQRPADDPVVRFIHGRARPIRLGRGNAPLEFQLPWRIEKPMLAAGGDLKSTIALAWDNNVVISPHIGDMETLRSQQVFEQVINDLTSLYHVKPQYVVCDRHPGYFSSQWARRSSLRQVEIYHHHAHAACLPGEFPGHPHWLVFTWDGTGYGEGGEFWGGEAFLGNSGQWKRVASLRPFYLPGADKASRQPWRSAAAISWELNRDTDYLSMDTGLLRNAWQRKLNCHKSTSAGRLFDAAAAICGVIEDASFEGQAPMWLEALADRGNADAISLDLSVDEQDILSADWRSLVEVLADNGIPRADRARCFHETMAQTILNQALHVRKNFNGDGELVVGLCGGVFQNRLLTEKAIDLLEQNEFTVYLPERVPVNDAGLSFGQIVEAAAQVNNHAEQKS